ncbi:hypothetical protein HDU96_006880 [Phlyctochytrium bullatum]|nr:hypothetical protein HDU96_006880 [Phlyctochytrium bullatum]
MSDHFEAVQARRDSLTQQQEESQLQALQALEDKIQQARQSRTAILKDRADSVTVRTEDALVEAARRKEALDQDRMAERVAEMDACDRAVEAALERHERAVMEKKARARRSLDDVSAGKARAEMRDAIRQAAAEGESQEEILHEELVKDRRDSRIDFVRQSQAHLQDHHNPPVESEVL